jgi:phosphoglycolate phosphatase
LANNRPAQFQAILFDFDGTLAPNLDLADMRRQIAAMAAATQTPADVYADLYIVEIITATSAWMRGQNQHKQADEFEAASHQRIIDIEVAAAQTTNLFSQARSKLTALRQQNIKLGIVTRNCRAAVLQMCPDLDDYVDALHARDDTVHLKPDVRHLQANLDVLNCSAQHSAMVGDGALDMQAGKDLNMYCIGVLSGSNDAQALLNAGANEVLQDYREI